MKKILIYILNFTDVQQLEANIQKVDNSFWSENECEILIISSKKQAVPLSFSGQGIDYVKIKYLYNRLSLGYGADQKLAFHYAIQNKLDLVMLINADGRFDPLSYDAIVAPVLEGASQLSIGTRNKNRKSKLNPFYYRKFTKSLLTRLQNRMLHSNFSEFYSEFRVFDVKSLELLPFLFNSNNYAFDIEILIQFYIRGLKITEVAIPDFKHYEFNFFNGLKYSWAFFRTVFRFKLHSLFLLYERKFDMAIQHVDYTPKLGYDSSHVLAISAIKPGASVLDLGCNEGFVSRELKKKACYIAGADVLQPKDCSMFDEFHLVDLNLIDRFTAFDRFENIIVLDVIEHLDKPEYFLDKIRQFSKCNMPTVIITTPNISFISVRLMLLFSQFNYGKQGILDFTHKRLFTFSSLTNICQEAGYFIKTSKGVPAPFPKALGINWLSLFLVWMNKLFIRLNKRLFSYQIYLEVVPTPMVNELLDLTIKETEEINA